MVVKEVSDAISKWFTDNQMQANSVKCHVLVSTDQKIQVNISTSRIKNSKSGKRLKL